jgi:hypothetical protein
MPAACRDRLLSRMSALSRLYLTRQERERFLTSANFLLARPPVTWEKKPPRGLVA